MMQLSELELEVLKLLLRGDDNVLNCLRNQLARISIKERESSSAGFFTTFESDQTIKAKAYISFKIGDVHGEISGLENGAGFVLYIKNGKLEMLEGYSYDEKWPKDIEEFKLTYINGQRDLEKLKLAWS
jgi:hypothetical protein